jgi:hypothetical protein
MKDQLLKCWISGRNKVRGFLIPKEEMVVKTDPGEAYVETGVKVVIAIVVGSLLLVGLIALMNTTILPTITEKINLMFGKTATL